MYYYKAFSLTVASEFELPLLIGIPECKTPDVTVTGGNGLSEYRRKAVWSDDEGNWIFHESQKDVYNIEGGAILAVTDGNRITVDMPEPLPSGLLQVYILGGGLGTILNQRGILTVHGSCVCKDGKAVLITGESGAGKSTLAHEFIENGWSLLTDDVSAIRFDEDGAPFVVPSYPSQKLWQDAVDRYDVEEKQLTSLWQEQRREKFNVDIRSVFHETPERLQAVIYLMKSQEDYDGPCRIAEENGLLVVQRLMRNIYRAFSRDEEGRRLLFQQCAFLGGKIRFYTMMRALNRNTAGELYGLITGEMK